MPQPRAPAPYAILAGYRNRGEFQYGLNTCASQGRLGDDRCQHTNLVTECQDLQLETRTSVAFLMGMKSPGPSLFALARRGRASRACGPTPNRAGSPRAVSSCSLAFLAPPSLTRGYNSAHGDQAEVLPAPPPLRARD